MPHRLLRNAAVIASIVMSPDFALSAGQRANAQNDTASLARLDGFVQGLTLADRFSGVVLVAEGGSIVFERPYGTADVVAGTLASRQTRFNLASAGKMFTTVAILQQVARGRLTLETPVGEVLTSYRNRDFASKVTVRHLLTHTSGAGDIDLFGVENAFNRERATNHAAMVSLHDTRPPAFEPGTRQQYGNFAYVILGRMVEVLSGEPYENYIRKNIFEFAGMTRTAFADCTHRAEDIAVGYVVIEGKQTSNCATLPARGFAAGGQLSTAGDMFAFVHALLEGRLLPANLLEDATRTQREFMGLGFFATDYGPDIPTRDFRWGHGGSADGICTDVRHYPATGETVIVLANRDAPACYSVAAFLHAQWRIEQSGPDTHAR